MCTAKVPSRYSKLSLPVLPSRNERKVYALLGTSGTVKIPYMVVYRPRIGSEQVCLSIEIVASSIHWHLRTSSMMNLVCFELIPLLSELRMCYTSETP
jgi:hypothetical protein